MSIIRGSYMYTADKNNEAKREPGPCNSSIYVCGINSAEEEVDENVDVEKRPTWDVKLVNRA